MTIWRELRCDRNLDGCYDESNNGPMGFEDASVLRRRGRKQGWKRIEGDDVCPSCAKAEQP